MGDDPAIRVFIGTEANQLIARQTLAHSIRCHTRARVEITPVTQDRPRLGGTNFGFVRFLVPSLAGYRGRAIYLDADQLVLADIQDLYHALDGAHDLALVQDPTGTFGGKPVGRSNQTSVMVLDCARLTDWDPATLFDRVVPNRTWFPRGRIRYRDFMQLTWFDPARIQALDPAWNHFNVHRPETRLIHFSHVASQPWKAPEHPLADLWVDHARRAIADGAIDPADLDRAIHLGHVHPHFRSLLGRPAHV